MNDFFVKRSFFFFDSGIIPILGFPEMHLFNVLCRFIRRAAPYTPLAVKLIKEGFVIAVVPQKSLAGALGTSRRQTVLEHLTKLKKLGWVHVQTNLKTSETCYVLGKKVPDSRGRKHEVLFADAWCQDVWDHLEACSKAEFGMVLGVDDDDGEEIQKLARPVSSTPWEWRTTKVRQFVEETSLPDCDHVVAEVPDPCTLGSTPPVLCGVHPLYAGEYTLNREAEVENLKREKREPEADSLRSSALSLGPEGKSPTLNIRIDSKRNSVDLNGNSDLPRNSWGRPIQAESSGPRRVGSMGHLDTPSKFRKSEASSVPRAPLPSPIPFRKGQAASLRVEAPLAPESAVTTVETPSRLPNEEVPELDGWEVPIVLGEGEGPVPEVEERVSLLERIAQEAKRRGIEARTQAQGRERRLAQKKANLAGAPVPLTQKGLFAELEKMWLGRMRERFPGVTIAAWAGKERGQVKQLIEKYGGAVAKQALDYVVSRWDDIRARFLKGKGGVPSIGFLLRFHDTLVVEAQRRGEWLQVKEEWERWQVQHPSDPYPPVDLETRYQRCKKDVDGLGLPT